MPDRTPHRLCALVALLALVAAGGTARAQEAVGTAAAVNPNSTGQGGAGTRVLRLGARIIHKERITTNASGSVQVLFVDKTTLNIGPSSNLVIDEFVYDPKARTGSMALSLTKGAVRFVGGNASHTGGAEVTTPVATIGIRGGVMGLSHHSGETRAILQFGIMTVVTRAGETIVVRRPGFMVIVGPNGVTGPTRVSQAEIDALIARTRSVRGQTGGHTGPVPDTAGLAPGSGHPCVRPVQGQTTLDLAAATCRFSNSDLQGTVDSAAQQASQQGQDHVLIPIEPYHPGEGGGQTPPPPPVEETPPPPPPPVEETPPPPPPVEETPPPPPVEYTPPPPPPVEETPPPPPPVEYTPPPPPPVEETPPPPPPVEYTPPPPPVEDTAPPPPTYDEKMPPPPPPTRLELQQQ